MLYYTYILIIGHLNRCVHSVAPRLSKHALTYTTNNIRSYKYNTMIV